MFERRLLAWTDRLHDWLLDRIWRREDARAKPYAAVPTGAQAGDLMVLHTVVGSGVTVTPAKEWLEMAARAARSPLIGFQREDKTWPKRAMLTTVEGYHVQWCGDDDEPPDNAIVWDRWRDGEGGWWTLTPEGWKQP